MRAVGLDVRLRLAGALTLILCHQMRVATLTANPVFSTYGRPYVLMGGG